jgi:hypothetical protein
MPIHFLSQHTSNKFKFAVEHFLQVKLTLRI